MTKVWLLIGFLALAASGQVVNAQVPPDPDKDRLYVTDQLRLSLYERPTDRSNSIRLLNSGDQLQIEELSGAYALVTTADGSKGWVKRGFLVSSPTANLLLELEKEKVSSLEQEIDKLSNSKTVIDQYENDLKGMADKLAELEETNATANETIAELEQEIENKQAEIDRRLENKAADIELLLDTAKTYWKIILPIVLLIMLLTFLVSKSIVEARIKSKFHGMKIW